MECRDAVNTFTRAVEFKSSRVEIDFEGAEIHVDHKYDSSDNTFRMAPYLYKNASYKFAGL